MKLINPKLHIAIQSNVEVLSSLSMLKIEHTFKDIFPDYKKVSDVSTEEKREIVFAINTPFLNRNEDLKEFFSDLEILLDELKEYEPYFTQFGGPNE